MASDPQGAEWIRLSTAVARMCEVASAYRNYVGLARRDLETAIRAGRVRIRGCSVESLEGPPVEIGGPITSQHELDLVRDSLSERRPGPLGASVGPKSFRKCSACLAIRAARHEMRSCQSRNLSGIQFPTNSDKRQIATRYSSEY